jgi:hypothetical protein
MLSSQRQVGHRWMVNRGWVIPVVSLCFGSSVYGEESDDTSLVSDREKVSLVEDSNVSEAVTRRPDLDFENVIIEL